MRAKHVAVSVIVGAIALLGSLVASSTDAEAHGWRYCRHCYGYYAPRVYSYYYAPRVYGYYYAPRYRVSGYRYSRYHW